MYIKKRHEHCSMKYWCYRYIRVSLGLFPLLSSLKMISANHRPDYCHVATISWFQTKFRFGFSLQVTYKNKISTDQRWIIVSLHRKLKRGKKRQTHSIQISAQTFLLKVCGLPKFSLCHRQLKTTVYTVCATAPVRLFWEPGRFSRKYETISDWLLWVSLLRALNGHTLRSCYSHRALLAGPSCWPAFAYSCRLFLFNSMS